jgi:16S rRNA (cytosine967-C5)-methyltransferase
MKPSARIQATIDILAGLAASRVPMDSTIGDYMRARRYIGSKDRAAIVERVYDCMRHHARIGWHLEKNGTEDTPRSRVIAHLRIVDGANERRIRDLFDASKYSPEELTSDELAFIEKFSEPLPDTNASSLSLKGEGFNIPPSVRTECPPEYESQLREYFGDDFENEMTAMIPPATLDLRVNTFICARDKALETLKAEGVEAAPTPFSPWGLRAKDKIFLSKTKAFKKGWVDIQDEGSQLIAHICGAAPGIQVLDFCAGGGGKTLALASAMMRKGRIVAMDTDARRLEKGKERFRRAYVSDIIEIRPLSDEKQRKWLKRQKENFDVVLVDAPCSGTGTWRRNPDLRWRNFGPDLAELIKTQIEILDKVVPCVKPGGRLVYATCSLLPEENEKQAAAFLERHPGFEIVPPENPALGAPFMRLTPYRHQTDGFFAAVFKKKTG